MTTPLQQAAQELIDRWDSPMWRYQQATTDVIAELRKALDAELVQSVEPVAWLTQAGSLASAEITDLKTGMSYGWTPLYPPPQPQTTTPKSEPLSDFEMRGVLASNLLCWNRLTEAEAQDLVCFFEKVRTAQGEKK